MAPDRLRSPRDRRKHEEDEAEARQKKLVLWGSVAAGVLVLGIGVLVFRGSGTPQTGTTDPEAKTRLEKLFQLYRAFAGENKSRGPANEQALKDYYGKLPPDQKAVYGDNVDTLFVNPRDGEKYVVRYGVRIDPGGRQEGIIWEKEGKDGKRFVALSMGYVAL